MELISLFPALKTRQSTLQKHFTNVNAEGLISCTLLLVLLYWLASGKGLDATKSDPPAFGSKKSVLEKETSVSRRERYFESKCWQSGKMENSSLPQNHLQRFCLAIKILKGRGEVISVNHKMEDQRQHHPPLHEDSSISRDLPLGVILFTQFGHKVCSWDY